MADSLLALGGLESLSLSALAGLQSLALTALGSAPIGVTVQAETPTFDPPAGGYTNTQNVTISSATPDAVIYYTIDGSTPDADSSLYTGPVEVAVSETLKAIVIRPNFAPSDVGEATYTIGAISLPIVNFGFETDVLAPGNSNGDTPTGWTSLGTGTPGDWGSWYPSPTTIGDFIVDLGGQGTQMLYIGSNSVDQGIYQDLSDTWIASKTYTLSFDTIFGTASVVGPADGFLNSVGRVQLRSGNTVLADTGEITDSNAVDVIASKTLVYATPASGAMIGQPIRIVILGAITPGDFDKEFNVDNFALSYI